MTDRHAGARVLDVSTLAPGGFGYRSLMWWGTLGLVLIESTMFALEFTTLNVTCSNDAYGSIVWLLLGLHTTHIATDVVDTGVLTALMFIGPVEEQRFVDVEENAVYWYFVVLTWLPIYGVIYWAPRIIS